MATNDSGKSTSSDLAIPVTSMLGYMHIYIALFLSSFLVSFLPAAEPIDVLKKTTWKSDKDATVKWIDAQRPNQEKNEKLKELFGKMTISFTSESVTTALNGKSDERPQKIIGQTTREIASITNDFLLKRDVIVVIEIDEDENGYWVYNSQFDIKEHFIPSK